MYSSQTKNYSFGLPDSVESGDTIFLNLFRHQDGRFIDKDQIDKLELFLNKNNTKKFEIKIYIFKGNSKANLMYTTYLSENLKRKLVKVTNVISIVGYGDKIPIFCNVTDKDSYKINSRIEIICL